MTAPLRKTAGSLLLALVGALAGCTSYFEIPIETPIQPKLDITSFQRVLVAGFVAGGDEEVDANLETVRLLRSQLRQKGSLRVIEAEALPLAELAGQQTAGLAAGAAGLARRPFDDDGVGPAADQGRKGSRALREVLQPTPSTGKRSAKNTSSRSSSPGWCCSGRTRARASCSRRPETYDEFGRRRVVPRRVYMERKGFILRPTFIFIDGRTGETLHSETFREEILYNQNTQTPALSSFFELMDRLLPTFLNAMSAQKIRGTRVLLK